MDTVEFKTYTTSKGDVVHVLVRDRSIWDLGLEPSEAFNLLLIEIRSINTLVIALCENMNWVLTGEYDVRNRWISKWLISAEEAVKILTALTESALVAQDVKDLALKALSDVEPAASEIELCELGWDEVLLTSLASLGVYTLADLVNMVISTYPDIAVPGSSVAETLPEGGWFEVLRLLLEVEHPDADDVKAAVREALTGAGEPFGGVPKVYYAGSTSKVKQSLWERFLDWLPVRFE
jgi:hypothetical protein